MTFLSKFKTCITASLAIVAIGLASQASAQKAPSSGVPFATALAEAIWLNEMNPRWDIYRGDGDSMYPHYGSHSLLLVKDTPIDAIRAGMMVLYIDAEGDRVAHLVDRVEGSQLRTRGAHTKEVDPTPVSQENLLGIVIGVMHSARNSPIETSVPVALGKRY